MPYVPSSRNTYVRTKTKVAHIKPIEADPPLDLEMTIDIPITPNTHTERLVRKYKAPGCCQSIYSEAHDVQVDQKYGFYQSNRCSLCTLSITETSSKWCDIILYGYMCCIPVGVACVRKKEYPQTNGNYYVGTCCAELVWASDEVLFLRNCCGWSAMEYNKVS